MSVTEARERLASYVPDLEVQAFELRIPSLGDNSLLERLFVVRMPAFPSNDPIETLLAAITLPPNKPVVWKVVHSFRFEDEHEHTKIALFAALRMKYGKESLTLEEPSGKISLFWVLGADGIPVHGTVAEKCSKFFQHSYQFPLAGESAALRAGESTELMNSLRTDAYLSGIESAHPMPQDPQHCQSTYIVAELSVDSNTELVNRMLIAVIDVPLDLRATEATRAVIREAETANTKQEIYNASERQTPRL